MLSCAVLCCAVVCCAVCAVRHVHLDLHTAGCAWTAGSHPTTNFSAKQHVVLCCAVSCCAVLCAVRHELEVAGIGLALQAMWAANVLDIQKTLHQV
jgi:hypothetical protein